METDYDFLYYMKTRIANPNLDYSDHFGKKQRYSLYIKTSIYYWHTWPGNDRVLKLWNSLDNSKESPLRELNGAAGFQHHLNEKIKLAIEGTIYSRGPFEPIAQGGNIALTFNF